MKARRSRRSDPGGRSGSCLNDYGLISIVFVEIDKDKTELESYALAIPITDFLSITFGSRPGSDEEISCESSSPNSSD